MIPLVGNFTPLNFDDVFASENIVDSCLIPLEVEEVSGDFDLNLHQPVDVRHQPVDVRTDEPLNESAQEFSCEERFEIIRSYHCDSPPSLSTIEKYDEVLKQDKKKYGSLFRERFSEIKNSMPELGIDIDIDEMVNDMFDRQKTASIFNQFPSEQRILRIKQIENSFSDVARFKFFLRYFLKRRINKIIYATSCVFDMRNIISTCLKIKKRWNSFIEILCSSKPFLYGAACFVWKGCKGITIGLINLAPTFNLFTMNNINNGANEERIVTVVQEAQRPILQELQSLKERISKSEIQVVTSEDYKDKYYALLEKFQTLQDKRTAELEVEMAQKDKKNEKSHLKEKFITELKSDTKEAHKVNEAVTKLSPIFSPVLSSSDYRKEKIMERRRSFSQPPLRMTVLAC